MKKFLMMIAALAMTTMFVQANEEAAPAQDAAVQAVQEATDAAPAPEGDKNATEEATPEEK